YNLFDTFQVVCDKNNPIYYLPDQLDNQVNENLDLTEVVNTFTFKPGQTYNWSNSSHGLTPKGSGKVIVLNAINVPSNTSVTLDGMNIEFWTDAAFDVYPNSTVNLRGTVCQGTSCGQMWKGISLLSSFVTTQNNLYMRKNTAGKIAEIRDAYTGVKLISRFSRFEASENSSFSANEKHVTLINTDKRYIKIENCYFNGSVPLKNPNRGSANGYADQMRRTITAIELVNSNVNIGNLSQPQNTIIGGQFGIDATGTILGLYRAECTGQKSYGVVFNANAVAGRTLWVEQCNLHDLYRGIRVSGKTQKTEIYQNNFKNTSGYAVEYLDNPGGKLLVGDQWITSSSNNFDNCNWAAIHCSNNAKYIDPKAINTDIQIYNNRINNHVYAAGIAVSEPTNAMRSYGIMKIMYNQMGTQKPIGQGVILKQIAGANPLLPLDRAVIKTPKSYFNQDFQVDSNVINYTNSFNAFYRGIWAEISTGQNYRNNTVTANSTGDWRPSAIRISDGKNNLLTENILHAGNGLQVTGDGMFSNYYCNTFNTCVIGIQLSWNFLRNRPPFRNFSHNDALYHAHIFDNKVFGRPNTYNSTISWGSDIHVYTNTIDRNLWDFNNNIVPKISYLSPTPRYPNGIVNNKLRLNLCNAEIIKDKDKDKDNDSSEIKPDLSMVDYASESNPVLQWKLKYGIARSNVSGLTHQTIGDSAINDLVSIEMAIQNRDYALAAAELNVYQPTNAIESDFKTVYSIWVHNRLGLQWHSKGLNHLRTDTLWTDSAEFVVETVSRDSMYQVAEYPDLSDSLVNILSGIAAQDATLVNPAAYPARAILWAERHLLFEDAPIEHWPNITGVVNSACTNNANAIVKLFHENGTYTGISAIADSAGFFFIDGGLLRHLDSHLNYYIEVRWPDSSTAVSPTARWKQLAYTSSHWLNCSSQATQLQFMGVSKNTLQELILYPNPGNGSFTLSSLPENWYLCLYDPTGRLMLSKRSSDRQYTHAEPLPGGVYLIKLTDTKTGQSVMKKYVAY
ncbi:MAG: T9SS C-terminal target domain-containing protein, partial [Bacteroidetes bacterium]|nr:T9SS C-terminal target domain-containing protein [Bacteroidota bacterium]